MRTMTLKSIPDELYDRLKDAAKARRRSMNSEALRRLEDSLAREPLDVEAFLHDTQTARERMKIAKPLTNRTIDAAKRSGRP